jgi:hypothetical protein
MRSRSDLLFGVVLQDERLLRVERDIENLLVEKRKETQQVKMPTKAEWETTPNNAKLESAAQRLT